MASLRQILESRQGQPDRAAVCSPDSTQAVPWNRVLKNNFWAGSHVFEWSDGEKQALQPLFDDTHRLQELSQAVYKAVPMALAGLSDRLGNIAIQLPVTVVITKFSRLRPSGLEVELAWRSGIEPRELRVVCALEFDGAVTGYTSAPIKDSKISLPLSGGAGMHDGFIWDDTNQVVLAATGPTGIINAISFNMATFHQEPRTFTVPQEDGTVKHHQIGLSHAGHSNIIRNQIGDENGGYTQRRIYKEQADHLQAGRVFVSYKPKPGAQAAKHEEALGDLRSLINSHGQAGVWLWDPFLSARDVLETLFHCRHANSDLRALADRRKIEVEAQRAILNGVQGNLRGLRLEYRIRHGTRGFGFHDRFLIFPRNREGALAWSLGTSVNAVGKKHHILQQVDNGELIKNDFSELWDQIDRPEYLVWKKP